MHKLAAITAFLVQQNLVAAEQIDSWVENPRIVPAAEVRGEAIVLYRQTYEAVISIERYPHKTHPAELLFALVACWLMDNDAEREQIATPQTEVDILDASTADIEITLEFEEDITAVEDPAGPILFNGKKYRLAIDVIDYAEEGEVRT